MNSQESKTWSQLYREKKALLTQESPPRARNAAQSLGVSEAQYVALSCGETVHWVNSKDILTLLESVAALGEVMALTRNDLVVLEHHGRYRTLDTQDNTVTVRGDGLDLTFCLPQWQFAFFVDESGRHSLQFFDVSGEAVHKIYLTEASDASAYASLLSEFAQEPCPTELLQVGTLTEPEHLPVALDAEEMAVLWRAHRDFEAGSWALGLGLSLPQAYRHLSQDAVRLNADALKRLLTHAAEVGLSLKVFVPNAAAIQIHHGPVFRIVETGPWINVLDERFNLHAFQPGIAESWRIKKYMGPDVFYESVEFFDEEERLVLAICLEPEVRTSDEPVESWTQCLDTLSMKELVA